MPSLGSDLEMSLLIIYSPDANLIVSLLDLHPGTASGSEPVIEVLEAGTGHGSLTLHLAKAIHAANAEGQFSESDNGHPNHSTNGRHRAVIHTVEVSQKHSEHAMKIARTFRRGMYMRDLRFHVADVSDWVDRQMSTRGRDPFLTHAILDLPSSYTHLEKIAHALHVDGKLVLFNPSITQINKAIELAKSRRLPLQLERVVEVGPAMTGGRVWDVRFFKPRALTNLLNEKKSVARGRDDGQAASNGDGVDNNRFIHEGSANDNEGYELVCRPKAGNLVSGGGFIALWSKIRICKDGR
ncbi:MAG: hypothetical protein LQ344_002530 [Seirophora lacunosa]|nr:MAG: hypothetical protein LQ344_002530 [Seirophora lacunosa]